MCTVASETVLRRNGFFLCRVLAHGGSMFHKRETWEDKTLPNVTYTLANTYLSGGTSVVERCTRTVFSNEGFQSTDLHRQVRRREDVL